MCLQTICNSLFMHLQIISARRTVNGLIWAYERSRIAVVVVGENAEIFANRGPGSRGWADCLKGLIAAI